LNYFRRSERRIHARCSRALQTAECSNFAVLLESGKMDEEKLSEIELTTEVDLWRWSN